MNEKALPLTMTGLAIVMAAISGGGFFMAKGAMDTASALKDQLEQNSRIVSTMAARLDELDAGMVALAKLSNIDGAELSRIMAIELSEIRKGSKTAPAEAEIPNQGEPPALAVQVVDPSKPNADAPVVAAQGQAAPMPKTGSESGSSPIATVAPAVQAKASESGEDFEAIVKNLQSNAPKAGATTNQQVESKPTAPLTMADVDGILVKRISEQWHKPAGVTDKMTVEIHIKMSRDGKLDKVDVTRSSGLEVFDRSAISALKSIGVVKEVAQLDDVTFDKAYRSRTILFSPEMMGG
jgi:colicin import membrane protein